MTTEPLWNSLEVAKLLTDFLTPIVILIIGYEINKQLRVAESRKERRYAAHIEIKIDCHFFEQRNNRFLVNFLLTAANRGYVDYRIENIRLRVRGIKKLDQKFQYWGDVCEVLPMGYKHRAYFPDLIIEAEMVPSRKGFIHLEPGVMHQISYPTIIPADYSHILAFVEFQYRDDNKDWPHNIEAIFGVPKTSIE